MNINQRERARIRSIAEFQAEIQTRIMIEEQLSSEFEEVAFANSAEQVIDSCGFIAVNGLVSRPRGAVGALWYKRVLISSSDQDGQAHPFMWIIVSIPLLRSLDSVGTKSLFVFLVELVRLGLEKEFQTDFHELEQRAYESLKKAFYVRSKDLTSDPAQELRMKIHAILQTNLRSGIPIIFPEEDNLIQALNDETNMISLTRKSRSALNAAKFRLPYVIKKESDQVRIRVSPFMFQIVSEEGNRTISPTVTLIPLNKTGPTVILVNSEVTRGSSLEDLEVLIAFEISHAYANLQVRGEMEREIMALVSKNGDIAESEKITKIFGESRVKTVRERVEMILNRLSEEQHSVLRFS